MANGSEPAGWARRVLDRELYWQTEAAPAPDGPADELAERLDSLIASLSADLARRVLEDEPTLQMGSGWRRAVKRRMHWLLRPVTRRQERIAADLAGVSRALLGQLRRAEATVERLQEEVAALRNRVGALAAGRPAADPAVEEDRDAYYWAYERRMRGTEESLVARLEQYRARLEGLRESAGAPALWIDLGCGRGEFAGLLQAWGWRVKGVDSSPAAVRECLARGLSAVEADAIDFLETYAGEPPLGISAIQLIEHLPKDRWLALFEGAHRVLRPGGCLLVETINPLDPDALASAFFADVTHTWPAHPETLEVMALHAGYVRAEVDYINPDHKGSARDYALWAWKG